MNVMPNLHTALLDLLYETRDHDLKLIIGGGYGQLRSMGKRATQSSTKRSSTCLIR